MLNSFEQTCLVIEFILYDLILCLKFHGSEEVKIVKSLHDFIIAYCICMNLNNVMLMLYCQYVHASLNQVHYLPT